MQSSIEEPKYIGLMQIGQMMDYNAEELEKDDPDGNAYEIIQIYRDASQIHGYYAHGLAIYFEYQNYQISFIEKEYLLAIQSCDVAKPIRNLADFYKSEEMYDKMKMYFDMAIHDYKDVESMVLLSGHYAKMVNIEQCGKYYNMAIEQLKEPLEMEKLIVEMQNRHFFMENNEIIRLTEYIDQHLWCKTNYIYDKIQDVARTRDNIAVYYNKVRLFQQLNYIVECGICLETVLNIDLNCGHCLCRNCYLKLNHKPCPFCRRLI